MSTQKTPQPKYLKDYQSPDYQIKSVDLTFDLHEEYCIVDSMLICIRNGASSTPPPSLVLVGQELELEHVTMNGKPLASEQYTVDEEQLVIHEVPERFLLGIRTRIFPHKNTSLEGLYKSGNMFCTQCEAEGFRKITYFPDRPDVMTRFTTRIIADPEKYPVLLSNGNIIEKGTRDPGRHWVRWEDPFRKPSYLFALVAGDLLHIEDTFVTCSGKEVTLRIYVEKENIDKCEHAMRSLKQSMAWDEKVYGREYDLDIFMIVAVNDFNMGAMENKGLNIFNSSYVLAKPETATDSNFEAIQGVIAHEYFHNWTGNRITCRDWFQLSLKEGLTIFRDQQFSSDMTSRTVKRIQDVNLIRTVQFAEDAGPMAHPVRPDSYIEINNFYTVTVYYKGAELIRMMYTLLGRERFHKGMDLYFKRHDGQAVTTEDFVRAMEEASGVDLKQFRRWYTQAGTPEVTVETQYDPESQTCTLSLKQTCPATPEQKDKEPFHIPVKIGLLDRQGREIPLETKDSTSNVDGEIVLDFKAQEQEFRFNNVPEPPVPSIFRDFSAPVKVHHSPSDEDLIFLMQHDTDEFNRWEASRKLLTGILLQRITQEEQTPIAEALAQPANAFRQILTEKKMDDAIIALIISLPTETFLSEQLETIEVDAVYHIRKEAGKALAKQLKDILLKVYRDCQETGPYSIDAKAVGKRSLKNAALGYLMFLEENEPLALCQKQFESATNMTDEMQALTFLANRDYPGRQQALDSFCRKWKDDTLVMNIWFSIQASSSLSDVSNIRSLMDHPQFDQGNPNKIRALIGTFCGANHIRFHAADGSGYQFLGDRIEQMNQLNPQLAARLLTPLIKWKRYDSNRQSLMKAQLKRILDISDLSRDVFEIAHKSLK